MCFDKRVVGALALVGVGVLAISPGSIVRVLPLLVFAICPLSMVFMGWAMTRGKQSREVSQSLLPDVAIPMEPDQSASVLYARMQQLNDHQRLLAAQLERLQSAQNSDESMDHSLPANFSVEQLASHGA